MEVIYLCRNQSKQIKMDKTKVVVIIALFFSVCCFAQERPVQTLRGVVNDRASGHPIPYATVRLTDIPDLGAVCDSLGRFTLPKVPVGRHPGDFCQGSLSGNSYARKRQ